MAAAAEPFVTRLRIQAPPEVVFDCFCDERAMLAWMGERAELNAQPGGKLDMDIGPVKVRGRYEVVNRPGRLVFSWGFADSDDFPPGASTVELTLRRDGDATELTLVHRDLPEAEAPRHALGWAKYLPRLAEAAPRTTSV